MKFHSQNLLIRLARADDASRIRDIYTPYIVNTVFNLEETVETIEYYERTILDSMDDKPFLVAEYNQEVIGFVYVSEVSFMLHLSNTCALSIYVAEDAPIRGVGQELFNALERTLSQQGVNQIIANIVATNVRSIKFHEKNGFQLLSTFPQAGYKFGQWHDVKWYGKKIGALMRVEENLVIDNIAVQL